jgi:lambda family phage minor tail protein L
MSMDNTIYLPSTTMPLAASLVIEFADMLGAKVTRYRVFAGCLDGQPNADPFGIIGDPDVFYVNRKTGHSKARIEFELTSDFDQVGLRLPKRQVLRDACPRSYRMWNAATSSFVYGTCPYNGTNYFDLNDNPTGTASQDQCAKRFNSCQVRFPLSPLPTYQMPGAAMTNEGY